MAEQTLCRAFSAQTAARSSQDWAYLVRSALAHLGLAGGQPGNEARHVHTGL